MGDDYEDLGPANIVPPPPPPGPPLPPAGVKPGTPLGGIPPPAPAAAPWMPVSPANAPAALGGTEPGVANDRTDLKSAPMGAPGDKGKVAAGRPAKAAENADEEEEGRKYTVAQKICMVISGIATLFFLMLALAAITVLATGFKILP